MISETVRMQEALLDMLVEVYDIDADDIESEIRPRLVALLLAVRLEAQTAVSR